MTGAEDSSGNSTKTSRKCVKVVLNETQVTVIQEFFIIFAKPNQFIRKMKKIVLKADEAVKNLSLCCILVQSKSPIPVLSDVLIRANGSYAVMTTSDGQSWLDMKTDVISCDDGFSICVNAKDLLGMMSELKGYDVTISADEDTRRIVGDYDGGTFAMSYDSPDEFPDTMNSSCTYSVNIDSQKLFTAMRLTQKAVSQNVLRPAMAGTHFDFSAEGMTAVAMNTMCLVKFTDGEAKSDTDCGFTLPMKPSAVAMRIVESYDGDVNVSFSDSCAVVRGNCFRLVTTLAEGKYAPYPQLFRKDPVIFAKTSADEVAKALRRIMPMSSQVSRCFKVSIEANTMTIFSEDLITSKSARAEVLCEHNGDDVSFNVNGNVLASILSDISECNAVFGVSSSQEPIRISSEEYEQYVSLIMPMK